LQLQLRRGRTRRRPAAWRCRASLVRQMRDGNHVGRRPPDLGQASRRRETARKFSQLRRGLFAARRRTRNPWPILPSATIIRLVRVLLLRQDLMQTRAAVAWKAGDPLTIETIEIEGPRAGEVLVEIKATGICHTDAYTLSGADPEGLFPAILGHEGAGVVREIGAGVSSLKAGDHVIPLYTPECRQCKTCLSRRS